MSWRLFTLHLLTFDDDWNIVTKINCCVARNNWIQNLLVEGPNLVPLHVVDGPAGPLGQDELLQGLHSQTSSHDSSDSRHSWIIPPVHSSSVHQPGQLPLGHDRVGQVQSSIGVDVRFAKTKSLNEPVELFISVHVLGCPQSMGDTLHTVNNGTGKVISGINFVFVSSSRVRLWLASVYGRISHAAIVRLHVNLGSHCALSSRV